MNEVSGSLVGLWIVFFLVVIAGTLAAFWWVMRTRNMKLRSSAPSNDRDQQHEEFIADGAYDVPPQINVADMNMKTEKR